MSNIKFKTRVIEENEESVKIRLYWEFPQTLTTLLNGLRVDGTTSVEYYGKEYTRSLFKSALVTRLVLGEKVYLLTSEDGEGYIDMSDYETVRHVILRIKNFIEALIEAYKDIQLENNEINVQVEIKGLEKLLGGASNE